MLLSSRRSILLSLSAPRGGGRGCCGISLIPARPAIDHVPVEFLPSQSVPLEVVPLSISLLPVPLCQSLVVVEYAVMQHRARPLTMPALRCFVEALLPVLYSAVERRRARRVRSTLTALTAVGAAKCELLPAALCF